MTTNDRRQAILNKLIESKGAVPAKELATQFGVSRQIIVGDMAIIRASNPDIISTNRGYVYGEKSAYTREFKVKHGPDRVKEELTIIVDYGGTVRNGYGNFPIYNSSGASALIQGDDTLIYGYSKDAIKNEGTQLASQYQAQLQMLKKTIQKLFTQENIHLTMEQRINIV